MKIFTLALLTVLGCATADGQDLSALQQPKPDKAGVILAIEKASGGHFMGEGVSIDGKSVRWMFDAGTYHGIPVHVEVSAFPSIEQFEAATKAAFAEAMAVYYWTQGTNHPDFNK